MRHSHTSRGLRTPAKAFLAIVGLSLAGACADSAIAPTSVVSANNVPAAYSRKAGTTTFRYTKSLGAVQRFGDQLIVIPAGAVCSQGDTYGAAQTNNWMAPCTSFAQSVTFTVTIWTDANGSPFVEFQPAVRFSPDKQVYLYLKDGLRHTTTDLTIKYCATADNCIDESLNNPSLATHRVGRSATVGRRLLHFSGYLITAGDVCSGTIETLDDGSLFCNTDDGRGFQRSGYMVASGLGRINTGDNTFGRRHRADK